MQSKLEIGTGRCFTRREAAYRSNGWPVHEDSGWVADTTNGSYVRVEASAVVHGNRKSPNAHAYGVTEYSDVIGRTSSRNYYTNNSNFWNSQIYEGVIGTYCLDGINYDPFFRDLSFPNDLLYASTLGELNEKTRGTLDLAVDIAESAESLKMIRLIRRLREWTPRRGWRTFVKSAANARLELQYGWKPLASSLYGAIQELTEKCEGLVSTVKVRRSENIPSTRGAISVLGYGYLEDEVVRNGRYLCEIEVSLRSDAFDISRWSSLNPISVAYELVPYSFCLDWIIDVGSYLRDIETSLLCGAAFLNGYVTEVTACDARFNSSFASDESDGSYYGRISRVAEASASGRFVRFRRQVLHSYPAPRLPTFKVDLGSGRLFNLASLLAQKLKGR